MKTTKQQLEKDIALLPSAASKRIKDRIIILERAVSERDNLKHLRNADPYPLMFK